MKAILLATLLVTSSVSASPVFEDDPSWAGQCVEIDLPDTLADLEGYLFEKDPDTALKVALYFARHGEVEHMRLAAFLLGLGNGDKMIISERRERMMSWLEKSANCGNVSAQEDLVNLLTAGAPHLELAQDLPFAKCIDAKIGEQNIIVSCREKLNK